MAIGASELTGAPGELIEHLIGLLRDPPSPDLGVEWTSDVFFALAYELDLWDIEDWCDPSTQPELALRQFHDRALYACEGAESADEPEVVTRRL